MSEPKPLSMEWLEDLAGLLQSVLKSVVKEHADIVGSDLARALAGNNFEAPIGVAINNLAGSVSELAEVIRDRNA